MKRILLPAFAVLLLACTPAEQPAPLPPPVNNGNNGNNSNTGNNENGSGNNGNGSGNQGETPEEPAQSTLAVKVYTGAASAITSTSANLLGNYTDAPEQGVYDRGVWYGTSSASLDRQAALSASSEREAYFTVKLSSLEPGTTYYYQVYVTAWDEGLQKYADVLGEVKSFTTETGGQGIAGLQYLNGYEVPAIPLKNDQACSNYGKETFGETMWYNYETGNDRQMVITHTYAHAGRQHRNYTCLVDGDKKAPLWSAFVMHAETYADLGVGRLGSWTPDPGIPESWQQSSATSTYSRGHFVASNYRQTTGDANRQTFYYTNQALQEQNGFNGALWASLEQDVAKHAPSGRDTLYVVVGILYEDDTIINNIPCPSHFYKCLMKCSFSEDGSMTDAKGCAYLFTNVSHSGQSYSSGITSIDEVEKRSGWDFFTNVPKALQDKAEAQSAALW